MSALSGLVLPIVAIAVLWLGIGAALAIAAARRLRVAETILGAAQAIASLLEMSPARPMLRSTTRQGIVPLLTSPG